MYREFLFRPSILRNRLLHLITIYLDSASWEVRQFSRRMYGQMKIPKLTPAPGSLGSYDCKVDALPHDHGHHHTPTLNSWTF